LLRCHCGHVLTGTRYRNGTDTIYTAYKCYRSKMVTNHGPGAVPEKRILPWVMAEAARLQVPYDQAQMAERDQDRRVALGAKRERIIDAAIDGTITKADRDRRLLEVDAELEKLDMTEELVEIPPAIDWSWPPERINVVLAAMWARVELDEHMQPVGAEWRVPEWRADTA
jgi:hypothetical protein